MHEEAVSYAIDGKNFIGLLVAPEKAAEKKPAILIAHAWMGRDDFAIQKARELANLGYVAFAADLYGDAQVVTSAEEATALMKPLSVDRTLLQKRIRAAFDVLCHNPLVDASRVGGIGFCFGGLTIIELLRSGASVKGVASFHATLGHQNANTVPIAQNIRGALLMLHGYDDPLVSTEDILRTQKEMNDANVNWQMNVYGHTSHAFTNPQAHDVANGLVFNPQTNARAWKATQNFFEEIFLEKIF